MFRPCFVTLHPKFILKISFIQCIIQQKKKTLQKDFQKIVLTLTFSTCSAKCNKIRDAKGKSQHALD